MTATMNSTMAPEQVELVRNRSTRSGRCVDSSRTGFTTGFSSSLPTRKACFPAKWKDSTSS